MQRKPVRANAVERSAGWPWSSAGQESLSPELRVNLSPLPIARRKDWVQWVDRPQTPAEEEALRRCVRENRPYGDEQWIEKVQKRLGWREPLKIGRPRKAN